MTDGTKADERSPLLARVQTLTGKPSHDVEAAEPPLDVAGEFWSLSSMALQVALSTFARLALTAIDSAFLGHLGTTALAASALATTWTTVPLMAVWAGASALLTLCGQSWGAKNGALTGVWLQMGLVLTTALTIPVFAWFWSVGFVLEWSTDDEEVVRLGVRFARILSLSIWPSLTYACVRLYFQAMGIMAPTTIVGAASIVVAIVANYFLIFGCFGWQGLGFDGSPLATVVASCFQPIALIGYCIMYKKMHRQAWAGWDFSMFTRERFAIFMQVAGPDAASSMIAALSSSALTLIAARLGPDVIAANAVISSLWALIWALFWGYGCATQIRVANYLGANRPKAARLLAVLGGCCTVVTVLALAIATVVVRENIFLAFTDVDDLLQLCLLVLPIFVVDFILDSVDVLVTAVLTAMSEAAITAWVSSLGTWVVELPLAYFGAITLGYGFPALWYAIGIMEITKLGIYAVVMARVDWTAMAHRAATNMENPDAVQSDSANEGNDYGTTGTANHQDGTDSARQDKEREAAVELALAEGEILPARSPPAPLALTPSSQLQQQQRRHQWGDSEPMNQSPEVSV